MATLNSKRPQSSVRIKRPTPVASKPATPNVFTPPAARRTDTVNSAGAPAYKSSSRFSLLALLSTSFNEDSFYASAASELTRLKTLIAEDPKFAAKSAIFVRNNLGNRSITQAAMVELANTPGAKGQPWLSKAFTAFVRRPDDITNILAYQISRYKKPIPNAMRRGLAAAFNKFDAYSLAKYRSEDAAVTLVDAVNMLHPKPTEKNAEALAALMKGNLRNEETWETLVSAAGSDSKKKQEAWKKLLSEGKLGYLALVRNLRNISDVADRELLSQAAKALQNKELLKKSLILPFQLVTAYRELLSKGASGELVDALAAAIELSCENLKPIKGNGAIFLDVSGSMGDVATPKSPALTGTMFAAALCKTNPGIQFYTYASTAIKHVVPANLGLITLQSRFGSWVSGGGTNLPAAYDLAAKGIKGGTIPKLDYIIILSDEQTWMGAQSGAAAHKKFCADTGCSPKVFTFDLKSYGTATFPEENVFALAGFSEKILEVISLSLGDKDAFIKLVDSAVEL